MHARPLQLDALEVESLALTFKCMQIRQVFEETLPGKQIIRDEVASRDRPLMVAASVHAEFHLGFTREACQDSGSKDLSQAQNRLPLFE